MILLCFFVFVFFFFFVIVDVSFFDFTGCCEKVKVVEHGL